jgi:hypothetical protein
MSGIPNYENISEVASTNSTEKANGYLKLGWVMLNIESHQHSEHGWNTGFVLGWRKDAGEIRYPEKTAWEKMAEQASKDESIPF